MSKDFNNINFPYMADPDKSMEEGHGEPADESYMSNIVGAQHPLFSSNGVIQLINMTRNFANTKEKELSGEVKDKVIYDIVQAARRTKCPFEILLFACDWEKDMTSRSDAGDAQGIAKKLVSYVSDLRQSLGRDPLQAEVFAAHALKDASKVKQIYDKAQQSPDDEAQPPGTDKDDIVAKKLRNKEEKPRTNRELYDFFYKRGGPTGKLLFKKLLGKDKYQQ
jgi:hypothetical protein